MIQGLTSYRNIFIYENDDSDNSKYPWGAIIYKNYVFLQVKNYLLVTSEETQKEYDY